MSVRGTRVGQRTGIMRVILIALVVCAVSGCPLQEGPNSPRSDPALCLYVEMAKHSDVEEFPVGEVQRWKDKTLANANDKRMYPGNEVDVTTDTGLDWPIGDWIFGGGDTPEGHVASCEELCKAIRRPADDRYLTIIMAKHLRLEDVREEGIEPDYTFPGDTNPPTYKILGGVAWVNWEARDERAPSCPKFDMTTPVAVVFYQTLDNMFWDMLDWDRRNGDCIDDALDRESIVRKVTSHEMCHMLGIPDEEGCHTPNCDCVMDEINFPWLLEAPEPNRCYNLWSRWSNMMKEGTCTSHTNPGNACQFADLVDLMSM